MRAVCLFMGCLYFVAPFLASMAKIKVTPLEDATMVIVLPLWFIAAGVWTMAKKRNDKDKEVK